MIEREVIAGPRFCLVAHSLATELRCSFSSGKTETAILSITRTENVGPLVEGIRSLLLCSTRLPRHKAVSEKDIRFSQHKGASNKFRLTRFVNNVLLATFCGLVRINL